MQGHSEKATCREESITQNQPWKYPDLGLLALKIVTKWFLLLKPSSLWYAVMADWAD